MHFNLQIDNAPAELGNQLLEEAESSVRLEVASE